MATYLYGNAFNNTMYGVNTTNNYIYGYGGNDIIVGGALSDALYGGDGADRLYGGGGNDWINGGNGNDLIDGGTGSDRLYDGFGNDRVGGGADRDFFYLTVDDQIDFIHGGTGSDIVDLSAVTLFDTVFVEDNGYSDGRLDMFWQDRTGYWQHDQIASVEWVRDADGLYLNVNDLFA
jgi:hypothetical protein